MAGLRPAAVMGVVLALWCGGGVAAAVTPVESSGVRAVAAPPRAVRAAPVGPTVADSLRAASVATMPGPQAAGTFGAVTPRTVLDTRSGAGGQHAPVTSLAAVTVGVAGVAGIPSSGVSAVVLNVTVAGPTASGSVTAFADGTGQPSVSSMVFGKGQTVSNLVVTPVGADGKVRLVNNSAGSVQLVVDISGYYLAGSPAAAGAFAPTTPSTLLDTRTGLGGQHAPVAARSTVVVRVAGVAGIPANVSAVVLRVTATAPTAPGVVDVFANAAGDSGVPSSRFLAGQTVSVPVVVGVGPDLKVQLYNNSAGSVQLVVDVYGYFRGSAGSVVPPYPVTPGIAGSFGALISRTLLDTRSGLGGQHAPVAARAGVAAGAVGVAGVPSSGVSAVLLNVTVMAPAAAGSVTVFADGASQPGVSTMFFVAGQTVSNLVVAQIGADGKVRLVNNSAGSTQFVVAIVGYYRAVTVGPPAVAGIYRVTGTTAGGGTVDLAGTNFVDVTSVRFGATDVPFTVSGSTSVTATVPAHAAGSVDVTVTGAGGTSPVGPADVYDFVTPLTWTASTIAARRGGAASLSCPSTSFCAVVDQNGAAAVYRGSGWSQPAVIDPNAALTSVSCVSATFCLATDSAGRWLTFDGTSWTAPAQMPGPPATSRYPRGPTVSCVSVTWCMAVKGSSVLQFTGAGWTQPVTIDAGYLLSSVSCPTTVFCAATDSIGNALFYRGGQWSGPALVGVDVPYLGDISCPTASFCVTSDDYRIFLWRGGAWVATALANAPQEFLTGLTCRSATWCVALSMGGVGGGAFLYDGTTWRRLAGLSSGRLISCASTTSCYAVDDLGSGYHFDGSTWSAPAGVDPSNYFWGLSCASESFCVATTSAGEVFRYDASGWHSDGRLDLSAGGMPGISCPSTTFCVALGSAGSAYTFDGTTWSAGTTITTSAMSSFAPVSCVSAAFCMAVTVGGQPIRFDGTTWTAPGSSIDPGKVMQAVECVSTSLCFAIDTVGNVVRYDGTSWSVPVAIDPGQHLMSISCASSTFCLAIDWRGVAVTFNGTRWSSPLAVRSFPGSAWGMYGVSCPLSTYCVAVDSSGNQSVFDGRGWGLPSMASPSARVLSCPSAVACVSVAFQSAAIGRR